MFHIGFKHFFLLSFSLYPILHSLFGFIFPMSANFERMKRSEEKIKTFANRNLSQLFIFTHFGPFLCAFRGLSLSIFVIHVSCLYVWHSLFCVVIINIECLEILFHSHCQSNMVNMAILSIVMEFSFSIYLCLFPLPFVYFCWLLAPFEYPIEQLNNLRNNSIHFNWNIFNWSVFSIIQNKWLAFPNIYETNWKDK